MENFLTHSFSGILIALIVLAIGLFFVARKPFRGARIIGVGTSTLGLVLLGGAITFLIGLSNDMKGWQKPPGQLVQTDAGQIHLWCVGENSSAPTAVWISGGHSSGLNLYHLQQEHAAVGRSCLIDRLGTGWSDSPKTPRTMANIADELNAALSASGERSPFLLIGHSLGGQTAVNMAWRDKAQTAGIVALDATPVALADVAAQTPESWCEPPSPLIFMALSRFGAGYIIPSLHPMNNPDYIAMNEPLAPVWPVLRAMESRPSALKTGHEAAIRFCQAGYDLARGAGLLDDMPLLSIVQRFDNSSEARIEQARLYDGVAGDLALEIWQRVADEASREYAAYSTAGELLYAPEGAGHLFPITEPEFTLREIGDFIERNEF